MSEIVLDDSLLCHFSMELNPPMPVDLFSPSASILGNRQPTWKGGSPTASKSSSDFGHGNGIASGRLLDKGKSLFQSRCFGAQAETVQSFKGHGMLAPFTAGWQATELDPMVMDSEPRLVAAAIAQLNKLPFYHSFWNCSTKPTLDLAKELLEMFTAKKMANAFLVNSGPEANNTQVKLAWYYNNALGRPNKKKFIARAKA
ncbi:hypothetical protein Droror1_Dr00010634 [Drosera rotundifolia]